VPEGLFSVSNSLANRQLQSQYLHPDGREKPVPRNGSSLTANLDCGPNDRGQLTERIGYRFTVLRGNKMAKLLLRRGLSNRPKMAPEQERAR
jgi:hypothetical protein